jgi:hypothetical protein
LDFFGWGRWLGFSTRLLQQVAKVSHIKIEINLELPVCLLQVEIAITRLMRE